MSIQSFGDRATENFFFDGTVPRRAGWRDAERVARRKLDMIHVAAALTDLRVPPGNRLEALRGDYADYHSVRINDQWRIVFRWTDAGPEDVKVVDYH